MPVLGRISSNKENATLDGTPNALRKPRLAGVGKAPTRARLLSFGKYNNKTAKVALAGKLATVRKASLVRGKRVADALSSTRVLPEAAKGAESSVPAAATTTNTPTTPTNDTDVNQHTASQPANHPGKETDTYVSVDYFVISDEGGPLIRVPANLPKPTFPPNLNMTMSDGVEVPTLYVQDRLTPLLPRILTVGSYFQPYPHIPSPPEPDTESPSNLVKSFAWGVPYIVNGHDTEGRLAASIRPFQPDVSLAIRKRDTLNAPFHLYAINYTVYASFFAHFPRRFDLPPSPRLAKALEGDGDGGASPMSIYAEMPVLDAIDEDSDAASSCSSTSDASEIAALEVGEHTHLPALAIELPDPDSFELIHNRLHQPFLKWQPALLGLPLGQATGPEQAKAILARAPFKRLLAQLRRVHGVWGNLVALGLENDAMWSELASAYNMIVSVLLLRSKRRNAEQ